MVDIWKMDSYLILQGPAMFNFDRKDTTLKYILGYVNSNVFQSLLNISCTGLHYTNGVVAK